LRILSSFHKLHIKTKDVYAVGVEVENDLAFVADVDGFKVVRVLIPSWLQ